MSHMTVQSIKTISRGLSMRLSFTISSHLNYSSNVETETYFIGDDLVQFFFEFTQSKNESTISPKIISSTTSKEYNSVITTSVQCDTPNFSEEWVCGSGWTAITMVAIDKVACHNDIVYYKFDIMVTVVEKKIESLHAQVYEDEDFTDFNLVGVNGKVAVHKVVLAASSPVFKAMLLGKWKETTDGNIELTGTTQKTLQHLKEFIYLGLLPDSDLEPLLLLAKCYMMDNLKTKCIKKLTESITCDNLYTSLEFACENNLPEFSFEILHFTSLQPDIAEKAYNMKTASPAGTSQQESSVDGIKTNEPAEGN